MHENEIANHIKAAIEAETPDVFDDVKLAIQRPSHYTPKRKMRFKALACVCSLFILVLGGYALYSIFLTPHASGPLAGQIDKYYVPFNASKFQDVPMPMPACPLSYRELLNGGDSSAIILCTVHDIGVYREKSQQFNPHASFGTYIYTVSVNKVLNNNQNVKSGAFLAVQEQAVAVPKYLTEGKDAKGWNFSPRTNRPEQTRTLKANKQYVMILSAKDNTGCYSLLYSGFSVFPMDYIEEEAQKDSLSVLEAQYSKETKVIAPLDNDILYKICALHMKNDFLNK